MISVLSRVQLEIRNRRVIFSINGALREREMIGSKVKLADDTPEAENMPAVDTLAAAGQLEAVEPARTNQDAEISPRIDSILEGDPIQEQEEDHIHEEDENVEEEVEIIQLDGLEDEGMHQDVRDGGNMRLTLKKQLIILIALMAICTAIVSWITLPSINYWKLLFFVATGLLSRDVYGLFKIRNADDMDSLGYTGTTIWAGVFLSGAICAVDSLLTIGTAGDSKEGVLKFDMLTDDLMVLKAGYRQLADACIDIILRRINLAGENPITYKMLFSSLHEDARLTRLRQKRSKIAKYKHYKCSLILVSRAIAALGGENSVCLITVTCATIKLGYFRSMGSGKGYPHASSRLLVDYSSSYDSVLRQCDEGFSLAAEADTNTGGRVIVLAALREEGGTDLGSWMYMATHSIPLPGLNLTHLR